MCDAPACRACLATGCALRRIDAMSRRTFAALTGLEIQNGDRFPAFFCGYCSTFIKKAIAFRRKSKRAHFMLQEVLMVKNEVILSDVMTLDRVKTNLRSPLRISGSKATIFNCLSRELDEELNGPQPEKYNVEDTVTEIKSKPIKTYTKNNKKIKPSVIDVTKLSNTLVDIQPDSVEEELIEDVPYNREEEVDNRDEMDTEEYDFGNNDIPDNQEIDFDDVFKDLKEESASELESLPEEETPVVQKVKKPSVVVRRKNALQKDCRESRGFRVKASKILAETTIRFLSLAEQQEAHSKRISDVKFTRNLFKCAICVVIFQTREELFQHMNYHNMRKPYEYVCDVCKNRFEKEVQYLKHSMWFHWYEYTCGNCGRNHYTLPDLVRCFDVSKAPKGQLVVSEETNKKLSDKETERKYIRTPITPEEAEQLRERRDGRPWFCNKCYMAFNTRLKLERHNLLHVATPEKMFECHHCGLCFELKMGVKQHLMVMHMFKFTCKVCGTAFSNLFAFYKHYKYDHETPKVLKKKRRKGGILSTVDYSGTCNICGVMFNNIRIHMSMIHTTHCNMCGEVTRTLERLFDHQLTMHGYIRLNTEPELNDPRYYCVHCQIYFCDEQAFYVHRVRLHAQELERDGDRCLQCGLMFDNEEELINHTCNSIPGLKTSDFECRYCDKKITAHSDYVLHYNKAHFGLPYRPVPSRPASRHPLSLCEYCGKYIACLSTHIKTAHTSPEAMEKCKFCSYKTSFPNMMMSHVLASHTHRPYLCALCPLRFEFRYTCREHILKVHAPVHPYACEACARRFSHLDLLHEHCVKAHGVDLKKTDKSVFHSFSRRMKGKIYVYPHLKIDGSLIPKELFEKVTIEICDYLDENNRVVNYIDHFYFDESIDPNVPTRVIGPTSLKSKRGMGMRSLYLTPDQLALQRKKDRERAQKKRNGFNRSIEISKDFVDNNDQEDREERFITCLGKDIPTDYTRKEREINPVVKTEADSNVGKKGKIIKNKSDHNQREKEIENDIRRGSDAGKKVKRRKKIGSDMPIIDNSDNYELTEINDDVNDKNKLGTDMPLLDYDGDSAQTEEKEYQRLIKSDIFQETEIVQEIDSAEGYKYYNKDAMMHDDTVEGNEKIEIKLEDTVEQSETQDMANENEESTENVMGQLVMQDGEYYVIIDDVMYKIENE